MKATTATILLAAALVAIAAALWGNQPGDFHEAATDRQSAIQDAANLITTAR